MKKSLFRGFKPVFAFTAKQNVKTKGFLVTTIIVALIMFAIPFAANVYMGVTSKDDSGNDSSVNEEQSDDYIKNIYFVNNTDLQDELIQGAVAGYCGDNNVKISVKMGHNEDESAILKNADNTLKSSDAIYSISKEDDAYKIRAYVLEGKDDIKSQVKDMNEYFAKCMPNISYAMAGLDMDTVVTIASGANSTVIKAGDKADDVGVLIVKMLLPMIVGLLLYTLINTSAQSVTKVVIAEKTSKLMETLLTSAMPYGIIAGKILAVTVVAVAQMFIWLLSLLIGFVTGNMVAEAICPGYENIIINVIDMIKDSDAGAFGVASVIIGIVVLMLGFLFYCVYAGFVGTFVQKAEDLGNSQIFLVFPLMISWLVAYIAPTLKNDALSGFVRMFPLTSPFSIPADVIVGNVTVLIALASMLILLAVTVAMILVTGYLYKKRVFK